MTSLSKSVYFFGAGKSEGTVQMRTLLGGKGANLAEMTVLGIPVPAGFTISTEECTAYYRNSCQLSESLVSQIETGVQQTESVMGGKFGDLNNPLLFSVRSGARVSMPGMMDTILNLGLNDESVNGLATQSKSERFAYDSYRRFIQMFSSVVLNVPHHQFEHELETIKTKFAVTDDTALSVEALRQLIDIYKRIVKQSGHDFPQDPHEQLKLAVAAVFDSWNSDRAHKYRQINKIPAEWGTAVNVQAMVFGNLGETSGTGVAFTRNPSTGERLFYGEYLMNAQGEDVVAGIRTPLPISALQNAMPEVYQELEKIYQKLELHFKEMQDLEFTIQDRKLYLLQTRTGKRTARAAVKIAHDMVEEGLIDKSTAIKRLDANQINQLLHPTIDPKAQFSILAKGLPASPGAVSGKIVLNPQVAEDWVKRGESVILVRIETSPEDIGGMYVSEGILTARGGMTSHAAVVARGMGKCCVAGCSDIHINESTRTVRIGDQNLNEGDVITLDGSTGDVILGTVPLIEASLSGEFSKIMTWVDEIRTLKVRANAETPQDATVAREFGAEGIGLCRTEHMFFDPNRIQIVREMILANTLAGRKSALAKLLPIQKADFKELFQVMKGFPVTIRLLDPPLHEFLPHDTETIAQIASELRVTPDVVHQKISALHEFNPMLGHRGCRLAVTYPEIYEMQAQAIMEAATELANDGISVSPEIMIPLVGDPKELAFVKTRIATVIQETIQKSGKNVSYTIGTMIEIPRAALLADEIAVDADFFSFGTNDLTQMAFGVSRDDAGNFLNDYVEKNILADDPFQVLDQRGVGKLIRIGIELGRKTNPDLKVGICGEHGGEASSVMFCHREKFDYVSCSPYRVPIARLAAAQACLQ